jgi:hypothetical protein
MTRVFGAPRQVRALSTSALTLKPVVRIQVCEHMPIQEFRKPLT